MLIPFTDLRRQHEKIKAEVQAAVTQVLASGSYILGREVEAFEEEWARYCGVRGCAAVNSGTDALALALVASGAVRQGRLDEVITSTFTAGYTALAIFSAGATPIFADIDPRTYTLDPEALKKALTPRTRAIVPVHIYGQMADMDAICEFATRHGLLVIEDAAQAHGARRSGRRAGAHGQASAFSFYPTKNLGAYGDGGAVTSDDVKLIERVKELRQGGHQEALGTGLAGRNSRLDEIQAAVLRVKLKRLDEWNRRRQQLAQAYGNHLSPHCKNLQLPAATEPDAHVYHLYVVEHPERESLRAYLTERGVGTMVHYPFLLHQQRLFHRPGQTGLPVAERTVNRVLSLPLHPYLEEDKINVIVDGILDFEAAG